MKTIKIYQKDIKFIEINILGGGDVIIQQGESTHNIEKESIPALISALDPERDKRIQELDEVMQETAECWADSQKECARLQSQLEEAKKVFELIKSGL